MNPFALLYETLAPIMWLTLAIFLAIALDLWGAKPKNTFQPKKPELRLRRLRSGGDNLNRN